MTRAGSCRGSAISAAFAVTALIYLGLAVVTVGVLGARAGTVCHWPTCSTSRSAAPVATWPPRRLSG